MTATEITLKTGEAAKGKRIDLFLAEGQQKLGLSRSRIQDLIRTGHITLDDTTVKPHTKLSGREEIRITIPEVKPPEVHPAEIPLSILYEDAHLIVVNKPAGMVVHPAPGNPERTLVNALLHHCKDLSGIGGVERPGIVHRLDKETSGVMVAVKNDAAHKSLSAQLKARQVKKIYLALVRGRVNSESGTIEEPIGRHEQYRKKMAVHAIRGRAAVTLYQVRERFDEYTFLTLRLKTGRTHQIRVHLAHIHHPIIGDAVYGGRQFANIRRAAMAMTVHRQMLHAHLLGFTHPHTGEYMEFIAEIPPDMEEVLCFLRGELPAPAQTP
jgi:23S rRNA pseudouridine1911/1915/1917 synthase